jgi:hypothetical protein
MLQQQLLQKGLLNMAKKVKNRRNKDLQNQNTKINKQLEKKTVHIY